MKGQYIEQPSYSLTFGKMMVIVSAPIIEDGTVVGVLAGRASLQSLNDIMLERAGLGDTGETYLVGSNYHLLTGLRDSNFTVANSYIRTQGTEAAIKDHMDGSSTYTNYTGERVIGVYRWIPDLKVALLAEQQEEEALYPTMVVLIISSIVTVVAIILAIIAARLLTRSIIQPLGELAETATNIAKGDLNQTAKIRRNDEVGTLARAFNSMTTQIRELFHKQEQYTNQLRVINEAGRQISSILQVDELLKYVASYLQKTFSYHNVRVILKDEQSGELILKASAGAYDFAEDPSQLTFSNSPAVSAAAEDGEARIINDVLNDANYKPYGDSRRTRAELAAPIKMGNKVVGILDIEAEKVDAFSELDLLSPDTGRPTRSGRRKCPAI